MGKAAQCVYRGGRKPVEDYGQASDRAQSYFDAGITISQSRVEIARSVTNSPIPLRYLKRSAFSSGPQPGLRTSNTVHDRPATTTPCSGTNAAQRIGPVDANTNVNTFMESHANRNSPTMPHLNPDASVEQSRLDVREAYKVPIAEVIITLLHIHIKLTMVTGNSNESQKRTKRPGRR